MHMQPPPCFNTFILYAYPAHYAVICKAILTAPHIITTITDSWFSISIWYDMEFLVSNEACGDMQSHTHGCTCLTDKLTTSPELYGGGKFQLDYKTLGPYVLDNQLLLPENKVPYKFVSHIPYYDAINSTKNDPSFVICRMPLGAIAHYLTTGQAKTIAKTHGLFIPRGAPLATIVAMLISHQCSELCYNNVCVFKPITITKESWNSGISKAKRQKRQKQEKAGRCQS